jgi:replicative DNA helicase
VNPATELVSDIRVVELAVKNINSIYKTIKKSEESPGTDYLFSGLDKKVAMAKQMDMVNSIAPPKIGSGGGPSSTVGTLSTVGRDNSTLDKVHIYDANKV